MNSGSDRDDSVQRFKLAVLGNGAVGKTSLIRNFCETGFDASYQQTLGLDLYTKTIQLPLSSKEVALQIWDIGGQQIGGKMIDNYIYGSHAILFVYDVTNPSSFKDLTDWKDCVNRVFATSVLKPKVVLVGNKVDLLHLRQVPATEHEKLATENGADSFFVSSRSGEQVAALFTKVAADLAGVEVQAHDLEMRNHVVATVDSNPSERQMAARRGVTLRATGTVPGKQDDCVMM